MLTRWPKQTTLLVQQLFQCVRNRSFNLQACHFSSVTNAESPTSRQDESVPKEGRSMQSHKKEERNGAKLWTRVKKQDPVLHAILDRSETRARIDRLATLMNCEKSLATELVKRNSIMAASGDSFFNKIKLILRHGFSAQDIVSNPSVLHRTYSVLEDRLLRLEENNVTESFKLSALKQPDGIFEAYLKRQVEEVSVMEGFSSRSQFLAHLLDEETEKIKNLVRENPFLKTTSLSVLKRKVNLLLEFDISLLYISQNVRILKLSIVGLRRRLELIKVNKLPVNDPSLSLRHLLLCSDQELVQYLQHAISSVQSLEGCRDRAHYLCYRLGCSREKALNLLSSEPLKGMSVIKMKTVLDFFLSELKVTPDFVIVHKRLLTYSVTRLRHRWRVLSAAGDNETHQLPSKLSLSEVDFNKEYGMYSVA